MMDALRLMAEYPWRNPGGCHIIKTGGKIWIKAEKFFGALDCGAATTGLQQGKVWPASHKEVVRKIIRKIWEGVFRGYAEKLPEILSYL